MIRLFVLYDNVVYKINKRPLFKICYAAYAVHSIKVKFEKLKTLNQSQLTNLILFNLQNLIDNYKPSMLLDLQKMHRELNII